jgi:hypothetical protein
VIVCNLLALQDGVVVVPVGDGEERRSVNSPVVHLTDTPNPGSQDRRPCSGAAWNTPSKLKILIKKA